MLEKRLLLPSAKIAVLVRTYNPREYIRWFFVCVGVMVIFIGLANILGRMADYVGGNAAAAQIAFAPLGTLNLGNLPAAVATTTPIIPAHIKIPSIGVDASVQQVGKKPDGSMATPTNFEDVGWYDLGSEPGQAGNAVIAGHVNNALTKSGVFEHLSDVKIGDYITIADASGKTLIYVVTETDQYPVSQAPAASIFSGTGASQIVLITCDGAWDVATHSYDKRFVVYARLSSK